MRNPLTALIILCAAAPALAASPADILAANRAAMGGGAFDVKAGLERDYSYAGQGMTGTVVSLDDLSAGRWVDDAKIGPAAQTQGFDGTHSWLKDQSGAVTLQEGGDNLPLAVNEAYRRANLWWRPGFGGANVAGVGTKGEGGADFDVLTVTPKNGKPFDAWFDAKTHLLARIVEQQGAQTSTTTLLDYRAIDGVDIAYKALVSLGDKRYDQILTVTAARFIAMPADSAFAMPSIKLTDFTIAGGMTSVPFELINNHIYAAVRVNDRPFTFIFDTGGVNVVTPPTAKALGLTSEGHMQGNGVGESHVDFGLTKVNSLRIGGAEIRDQVFPVAPLDELSPIEGVAQQGMVGFETFRRFVTRVDYGTKTLTLIDPKRFDPKDAGTPVSFKFDGNNPAIEARIDGHAGTFTVDTGSRVSLTLNTAFAKQIGYPPSAAKSVAGVSGWGIGGPSRATVFRAGAFAIGPFAIEHPVVEASTNKAGSYANAAISGNIGAGILKRYVVTLDYEHMTIYLKPIHGAIADLDTFDRTGMWFNEGADGFDIVDVMPGTPAAQAGLKAGDVITAVDGKNAQSIHLYELRRSLRDMAPGTVFTFAVKGKGDAKVTSRDLI